MALTVQTSSFAPSGTTGNQTVTIGGSFTSATPELVIFYRISGSTEDALVDHAIAGYGAAVSSTERMAIAVSDEHNSGTSDTHSVQTDADCIIEVDENGAVTGLADFVSFGTNQFTINWSNALSASDSVYYIAIAGLDDVAITSFQVPTSSGNPPSAGPAKRTPTPLFRRRRW